METALSLVIGIGLSATCGFRVFVPFLVMSIASLTGHLELAPSFSWIGTYPALAAFSVATLLEILAYFFPYIDNLLSTISAPVTVIAGTIITASVFFEAGPFVTWVVAIIAGGGSSLVGKSASAAVHAGSTSVSGGTANPVLSAIESAFSGLMAVLSVLVPVLVIVFLALMIYVGVKFFRRLKRRRRKRTAVP